MALSFCSNLGYTQHQNYFPELPHLPDEVNPKIGTELLGYYESFIFPETYINPFLDLDELFYSESHTNVLPSFSSTSDENILSLSPEIFPYEEVDPYNHYLKRQKSLDNHNYCSTYAPAYFSDDCFANFNPNLAAVMLPEIPAPVPKFEAPAPVFSLGRADESVKKPGGGGLGLSAQSIAARERRRKITEKTQELGKLIPGGSRMNTAEMFQAASKYVKFLQAQVEVLKLMAPIQETDELLPTNELQNLVTSTTVQEKLYSSERCLVLRETLEDLANDPLIQSKSPSMIKEIEQLL